jgi:glycosyltransferase involved in cell wall biosynthesis
MKVLLITNKVKTYALGFQNVLEPLKDLGHEVVWAADFSNFVGEKSSIPCVVEHISINTNPLNPSNRAALKQVCEIIKKYDIQAIQCSTPIGGLIGRLAGKKMHISPVIYSAHGFLFFKGAPLINRTVYKWEEDFLARYTDVLITITEEDYNAAQKIKIRSGRKPFLIHGAGVKGGVTVDIDRNEKRRSLGVPEDAFIIVSAGELNKNKNTEVIVKALKDVDGAHYIACGVGPEKENLEKLAQECGVTDRFHLMGYRTDMPEIMACADVFTMMAFREGMPRAVLEAMDLGLPCVGSDTRGIRDLIDNDGGFICKPTDAMAFAEAFTKLRDNPEMQEMMGEHNRSKVNDYSADVVRDELTSIYRDVLREQ